MSLPKEPRQKMINMMYLVLTALLALNVSAEILKAFTVVNKSLEDSNKLLHTKNESVYSAFEKQMSENATKTKPFRDKALEVQAASQELISYIQEIKGYLIDQTGNKDGKVSELDYQNEDTITGQLVGEKDTHTGHDYLLVTDQGAKGKELRQKITDARAKFLSFYSEEDRVAKSNALPLKECIDPPPLEGVQKDWQTSLFADIPMAAVVTLLSKFETDVRAAESQIIVDLINNISAADFKFDKLDALVVAKSAYVMQGSEYEADIFIGASSSTQNPVVIIGNGIDSVGNVTNPSDTQHVQVDDNGKGKYKTTASSVGEKEYRGVIKIKDPQGDGFKYFPFKSDYMVAAPQAVVSPTKMNVLYIGVDNPLAISAAGVSSDKVQASLSGAGTLRPGPKKGEYLAKMTKPGSATVTVSVKGEDGTMKKMGAQEFRVKRVPDPIAKIANQSGGNIKSGTFKAQRGISAILDNFDFEFRYQIVSFEATFAAKRQDLITTKVSGALFDQKMKAWMSRAKPGDMFYFDNIKARGEDGSTRKLPSIAYKMI